MRLCRAKRSVWLGVLLLLLWPMMGGAHNRSTSYSQWQLRGESATVQARVPALELTRLGLDARYTPRYQEAVGAELAAALQLWSAAGQCQPQDITMREDGQGWLLARWSLQCPVWRELAVVTRLFETVAPSHLHFVHLQPEGRGVRHQLLSFGKPLLVLGSRSEAATTLQGFVAVGVMHILTGWDHLAFLIGLVLLAQRLRELALLVTGFTIAHSLTLMAAVLGWVQVEASRVEALIGFSIALVAVEALWLSSVRDHWLPRGFLLALAAFAASALATSMWPLVAGLWLFSACYFAMLANSNKPWRWRVLLSLGFGLVHGFGFAGAMAELQLPRAELGWALFGFNLGVECGQLLIIALLWPLLIWLRKQAPWHRWGLGTASASLAGLGTFWWVTRMLGH